jgi:hypothetical protein
MTDTDSYSVQERLITKNVKLSENEIDKMCNSVCLARDAVAFGPPCTLRTEIPVHRIKFTSISNTKRLTLLGGKLPLFIVSYTINIKVLCRQNAERLS